MLAPAERSAPSCRQRWNRAGRDGRSRSTTFEEMRVMRGREIREALHAGRRVYSTAVTAPSPRFPELLRKAGIDFVFIDTEHTPLGRETLSWMCQAFAGLGIPPVVRVPSPDPFEATKVLDGGAGGVIGPYV